MKTSVKNVFFVIIMGFVIPELIYCYIGGLRKEICSFTSPTTSQRESAEQHEINEINSSPEKNHKKSEENGNSIEVEILHNGKTFQMDLEEYLVGVVLGEMPARFDIESLKAQAVVARTFTMRRMSRMDKHPNGAVCTDSGCCQAYLSPETYIKEKGGSDSDIKKIRECVKETAGKVLTYQGEYIEATYFSSSGGQTEDAVAVWGADVPYLRARECPGEADVHEEETIISRQKFCQLLDLTLDGLNINSVTYTGGGGVDQIIISGKCFSGTEIRRKLKLNSTMFHIEIVGENISIHSRGFGHRVGLSQYGADAMAQNGARYTQILEYFYPGTRLQNYYDD